MMLVVHEPSLPQQSNLLLVISVAACVFLGAQLLMLTLQILAKLDIVR